MIPQEKIELWLKNKIKHEVLGKSLTAFAMFILSSVILFITFWVIYVVIYLGSYWIHPLSHTILCWSSFIVIGLLFWGNSKTSKEYLSEYSFTTGTATDEIVVFTGGGGSNINPLAPDSMHSYTKLITNILYIGPNTFMFALRNLKQTIHLSKIDISECGEVIKLLFESEEKIPISDITSQLSLTCNKVFLDLSCLDGILFLSKGQPSLALSSNLKEELESSNS